LLTLSNEANQEDTGLWYTVAPTVVRGEAQVRRIRNAALGTAILVFTIPCVARADAGTALMWAGLLQMLIGNFFVGLGEGCLLAWRYKTDSGASVLIMILANYVSAWLGLFLVGSILPKSLQALGTDHPPGLRATLVPELLVLAGLFVVTVLIEWPFCLWALRRRWRGKGSLALRSFKASLLVQAASYAVLVPLYLWVRTLD
jgi:hypothetical protein